jgi:hypothetical protein
MKSAPLRLGEKEEKFESQDMESWGRNIKCWDSDMESWGSDTPQQRPQTIITKADFVKLVNHPNFALPFDEAANGRNPHTEAVAPYGPHARGDVLNKHTRRDPSAQTTELNAELERHLARHSAQSDAHNRKSWHSLAEALAEEAWAELWARNGYREAVAWAIEATKEEA